MTVRLVAGVGALLLAMGGTVLAQSSAEAHFHEAAQHYIAEDLSAARQAVERGLEVAPSDPRLLSLQKKLEQTGRSQSDESSQKQGGSESQNTSSGNQSSNQSEEESEQGEQNQPGSSEPSGDSSPQSNASSPSVPSDASERGRTADGQRGGSSPEGMNALSRAQAERLLQALEGQEKRLLREVQTRSSEERSVEKDW